MSQWMSERLGCTRFTYLSSTPEVEVSVGCGLRAAWWVHGATHTWRQCRVGNIEKWMFTQKIDKKQIAVVIYLSGLRSLRCSLLFAPSRISMLHRASIHSFSPAALGIESTATVKFVSSKCGCCALAEMDPNNSALLVSPLRRQAPLTAGVPSFYLRCLVSFHSPRSCSVLGSPQSRVPGTFT